VPESLATSPKGPGGSMPASIGAAASSAHAKRTHSTAPTGLQRPRRSRVAALVLSRLHLCFVRMLLLTNDGDCQRVAFLLSPNRRPPEIATKRTETPPRDRHVERYDAAL